MGGLQPGGMGILLSQAHGRLVVILQRIDAKEWPKVRDEVQVAADALQNAMALLRVPPSPPTGATPTPRPVPPSPVSVAPDSPPAVPIPPESSRADPGVPDAPSTKGGDERGPTAAPAVPKVPKPKPEVKKS